MNIKYEVGTHNFKQSFDCLQCAKKFYNGLEDKKKYLMDKMKNTIIKNTYGWEQGE